MEQVNEHRIHMNWEFWMQVCWGIRIKMGHPPGSVVEITAAEAAAFADLLVALKPRESWQIHLYVWGDGEGQRVGLFEKFCRAGGFRVVDGTRGKEPRRVGG